MPQAATLSFSISLRMAVFPMFLGGGSGTGAQTPELPSFSFWEEPGPPEFSFTVPLAWQETGEFRIAFQVQPRGDFYYALCSPQEQGFFKVKDGGSVALGCTYPPPFPLVGERLDLTLQRGPWRMALILGDQVVARAWDAELPLGKIGWWASTPAWRAGEPRLQPREAIYQTDDFMRTKDAPGEWEVWDGDWAPNGPQLRYATAERSANPFTYRAHLEPHQIGWATTGYGFWSNYRVEASVKPEGEGAIGLGLYVRDGENFLLFRWTSSRHAGRKQWVQVRDGEETALAEAPGGYVPGQWVRLRAETVDGQLFAFVDGQEVLRAQTHLFGQGPAGFYVQAGEAPLTVHFDDLLIESVRDFRDEVITDGPGPWLPLRGSWWKEADGSYHCGEGEGLVWGLTGPSGWEDYRFQAVVDPPTAGWVGLCFAYQDPDHYGLLKTGPKKAQLIRVARGKQEVLDYAAVAHGEEMPPLGPPRQPGESGLPSPAEDGKAGAEEATVPLSVQLDRGFIQASAGDVTLAAFCPDLKSGPAGLMAENYSGGVSDLQVNFPSSSFSSASVKASFQADPNMRAWATSAGEWEARAGGEMWHKARLYGTTTVELTLPPLPEDSSLEIVLGADDNGAGGYRLIFTPEGEGASWQLARSDRIVASGGGTPQGNSSLRSLPVPVRFQQRGPFLAAWADGHLFALFRDPQPGLGTRVILRPRNLRLDLAQCHVSNENGWDDSFHHAPVDWWMGRGTWSLAQRWACSAGGQWTFFGGFNDLACVLWSKRVFAGDQTLEFFVGPAVVGGSRSPEWRDFNAVICGDGANLDSGYTLILSGRDGRSRLYRKGRLLTEASGGNPSVGSADWPAVRLEKHGNRLRAFYRERLVLEATDPEPLEGGQVAVWTYRNNILLPRARVWARGRGPVRPFPVLPAPPNPTPAVGVAGPPAPPDIPASTNDFEQGLGTWGAPHEEDCTLLSLDETTASQGQRSLKVVNTRAGGYFTVRPAQEPVDVARFPVLHFDYRVPPEVKVNLYLRVEDAQAPGSDWWEITFTAPGGPTPRASRLGAIPDVVADREWHHAEFDVGGALERALEGREFTVQGIAFAAPQRDYLPCGLGGNPFGATYHLDDFRWAGRE